MAYPSLKTINRRIQKREPLVTLVKNTSMLYHYFVFDNVKGGLDAPRDDPEYVIGDRLVYETKSDMTPYTSHRPVDDWIEDAVEFGRKMRERGGLPEAG